jgi:HD superfamily phosphodiesterase
MSIERLTELAQSVLMIPIDESRGDPWLWEHSQRVVSLTRIVAQFPEIAPTNPDLTALSAAALFHDAGWAAQFRQGRIDRWQILARPTNEIQRELGAAMLQEHAVGALSAKALRLAADAIRQCNDRRTALIEAQILAEAEALDEVGLTYVLRQFRAHQAEGRPLRYLLTSWQRQREYHFWDLRLTEGFRFDSSRRLARERLAGADQFMELLHHELGQLDSAHAGAPA